MRTHTDYRSKTSGKVDSVIMCANVRQNFKKEKEEILIQCCVSTVYSDVIL